MSRITVAGRALLSVSAFLMLVGCAGAPPTQYDYSALRKAQPKSIVILPPTNESPEVGAGESILSTATFPVAEDGYYVLPVALVSQTFKENGVTTAYDSQQIPLAKLREIFGADAALYINVTNYGTSYKIVESEVRVTLHAKLVDLRSGELLWEGHATASNQEGRSNNQGLLGMLIGAVIEQIANNVSDAGHRMGVVANRRLLSANRYGGLLYGPRSPKYEGSGAQPPPSTSNDQASN